ncbi:hypothetical protein QFZ75_001496 [Streptomyces sp. V3I8]|uniref:glycoside hydrolase family 75 protein n=1 Tax=Streptomyces sp. V3I8 TaxID=3042279 RepID=UPI00278B0F59|nr:glycoside hydrolase family 75 protein [Streptomyces sp. V3I8]MDQ1035080.1 hypothetical protein [Streptomyces sp. V3I8]
MRMRTPALAAVGGGAALLAAAALPIEPTGCSQVSRGRYRTDAGKRATVAVCGRKGAVLRKADLDIDCDGQVTARCNRRTDPWFQDRTAFPQSDGRALNSQKPPCIVAPPPGRVWNYADSGVRGGSVAAVIHQDRLRYAVVGDTGPAHLIGAVPARRLNPLRRPVRPAGRSAVRPRC